MDQPGLIEQWNAAKRHPYAAVFLGIVGGFVPFFAYRTTHGHGIDMNDPESLRKPLAYIVAAALLFSVRTVWSFWLSASDERLKATTLVIVLEGSMVLSPDPWLQLPALALLIGINAIATAGVVSKQLEAALAPKPSVSDLVREHALPRRKAAELLEEPARVVSARKPRPA